MNTDKLIAALAADGKPDMPPGRMVLSAALAGFVIAAVLFFAMLGPRPDFMAAIHTPRFVFKFVVTLALAASAAILVARAARPAASAGPNVLLLLTPTLLVLAVVAELFLEPANSWTKWLIGHNARVCMLSIPILSLGPLAILLVALRQGATTEPGRAGLLAGLAAGGLGAALYAAHCPDDSPLFVAVWYTLAIALIALIGGIAGRRMLRW
ncbi:MAG TPA: NrsF family protein [Rhizomicrobium sp.]|nr:NrsF family protein [Rhizomicrobium sp.]